MTLPATVSRDYTPAQAALLDALLAVLAEQARPPVPPPPNPYLAKLRAAMPAEFAAYYDKWSRSDSFFGYADSQVAEGLACGGVADGGIDLFDKALDLLERRIATARTGWLCWNKTVDLKGWNSPYRYSESGGANPLELSYTLDETVWGHHALITCELVDLAPSATPVLRARAAEVREFARVNILEKWLAVLGTAFPRANANMDAHPMVMGFLLGREDVWRPALQRILAGTKAHADGGVVWQYTYPDASRVADSRHAPHVVEALVFLARHGVAEAQALYPALLATWRRVYDPVTGIYTTSMDGTGGPSTLHVQEQGWHAVAFIDPTTIPALAGWRDTYHVPGWGVLALAEHAGRTAEG